MASPTVKDKPVAGAFDTTTAERLARIETSIEGVRGDILELRNRLNNLMAEIRSSTNTVQGQVNTRDNYCAARSVDYDHMARLVNDHELRLDAIEKLMPAMRAVLWIGSALGVSVLALIWSLITGQAQVIFR